MQTEKRDIKNYLHLYLGCNVEYRRKEVQFGSQGKLTSVSTAGVCVIENRDIQFAAELEKWEIKLILRPLSDMTEEEAAHIGQLVYGKPDSIKWRIEHKNGYLKIYRKHYQKAITIDYASADLDFYDGDELDTSLRQIEIFQYLLSKSFDLFGLIDADLAIDATKTIQPVNS